MQKSLHTTTLFRTLVFVGMLVPGIAADAQNRKTVPDGSCATCRIQSRLVTVLGSVDGPGSFPGEVTAMARDSRGRYYLLFGKEGKVPMVFESTGRYLTSIGRIGKGPAEYSEPGSILVGLGDTLYVLDRANARLTVLDPNYRYVRTAPIPYYFSRAIFTTDGAIVINATIADTVRAGYPFHAFDRVGNTRGSFGAVTPEMRPRDPYFLSRIMGAARGGGVWATPAIDSYRLERWLPNGTLTDVITRETKWFAQFPQPSLTPNRPLPTMARFVWEDRNGLLWIGHLASAPGFAKALKASSSGKRWDLVDMGIGYDGHLEVLDPVAGKVLATKIVEDAIYYALGNGLFAARKETPTGALQMQIWQMQLNR